jgi:hypothetical protein
LSRLIKAAVSRQREALADASAVQFTREPMALASALKKIGGFTTYLETVETEEVSHMLFGRAGRSFAGWFATHPPLAERIKALDPSFEPGDYVAPVSPARTAVDEGPESRLQSQLQSPLMSPLSDGTATIEVDRIGTIDPAAGTALHGALPFDVVDAAHSSQASWLLVLALGLERGGGSAAERQLLETQLGADRAERCIELRRLVDTLDPGLLLPLFELTIPALKARPSEQLDYLFELLSRLAEADGEVTFFEYMLQRMLSAHFRRSARIRSSATERFAASCTLLATMSLHGGSDPASMRAAFTAGLAALGADIPVEADAALEAARSDIDYRGLDQALSVLASAAAAEQRRVLTALAVTMRHDRKIGIEEAELFRTVAAVLHCPVPPTHAMG